MRMNKKFMKKVVLSLGIGVMGASSLGIAPAFAETYSYKNMFKSSTEKEYLQKVNQMIAEENKNLTKYKNDSKLAHNKSEEELEKQDKINSDIKQYKKDLEKPKADVKSIEAKIAAKKKEMTASEDTYKQLITAMNKAIKDIRRVDGILIDLKYALTHPHIEN